MGDVDVSTVTVDDGAAVPDDDDDEGSGVEDENAGY